MRYLTEREADNRVFLALLGMFGLGMVLGYVAGVMV